MGDTDTTIEAKVITSDYTKQAYNAMYLLNMLNGFKHYRTVTIHFNTVHLWVGESDRYTLIMGLEK